MPRILVVDNYDSFVFNLVQYLAQLGAECAVFRNDALTAADAAAGGYDGVLLSPGPGVPADAGVSESLIRWAAAERRPLLGVCLGHQALAEVFGGEVVRAPELLHGKTSQIDHDGSGVFAGLPGPLTVTRYHSLAVAPGTMPDELLVTATTRPSPAGPGGVVMGLRHRELPLVGVQFHPESVLTEGGHRLLANWLDGLDPDPQAIADRAGRVTDLAAETERLRRSAG